MNRFIAILLTISLAGSILFLLFLLLNYIFINYDAIIKSFFMKILFLFFFLPALSVPFIYFLKNSPIVHNTKGADIHMWIEYTSNSEFLFKQDYFGVGTLIFYVWLIGFLITLFKNTFVEKVLLEQIAILSEEETDKKIKSVKERIIKELHINKEIPIYRTNLVGSPCVCGIFHVKIILPKEQYSETDIEFILKHELYHYKKYDIIFNILLSFFWAFYWFNPLIKLITKQLLILCEMSCDQFVLKNSSRENKIAYAELLIRSSERKVRNKYTRLTSFTSQGEDVMKKRLYGIMKENLKINRKTIAGTLAILSVLCPATTFAATLGVTNVYNKLLANTDFSQTFQRENEEESEKLSKEYEESVKETEIFILEDRGSNSIDMKISGNKSSESKKLYIEKGDSLKIFLVGEKTTDKFKVVIKAGQKKKLVKESEEGEVNYTYTADETANYTITIKNLNSNAIHVNGVINIR